MNRAIAAVYSISIGSERPTDGRKYTDRDMGRLVDCIPALCDEVNRMERLLDDPFIRGYLEARKQWTADHASKEP